VRCAIVTGAGSGIGAACARRLAEDGHAVVLSGRRRGPLDAVAADLARAVVVPGDVGEPAHASALVAAAREAFGGVDTLVLNAGIGDSLPVADESAEGWDAVIRTNLTGAFLAARAALPALVERRGSAVAVASTNAWRAGPGWAAYCASKAGLVMLTQSIARDYGPAGVRANAVLPGWVRTPMGDADMDAVGERHALDREGAYELTHRHVPLRRAADAVEVAAVVAFLASSDARYVTGAALPVDGGASVVDVSTIAWDA
jgi:NAD(P)-dependent dehydrogenase (short-subunit alcohol dehydrogenase family)